MAQVLTFVMQNPITELLPVFFLLLFFCFVLFGDCGNFIPRSKKCEDSVNFEYFLEKTQGVFQT